MMWSKVIAIDTETAGLDVWSPRVQMTMLTAHANDGKTWIFRPDEGALSASHSPHHQELSRRINDPNWLKVFYNAKFDLRILQKEGIRPRGPIIDVFFMVCMLFPDEQSKGLKQMARKVLDYNYAEEIRMQRWLRQNKGQAHGHAPAAILEPYATADAIQTLRLFYALWGGIEAHSLVETLRMEMRLLKVVMSMEAQGLRVDLRRVKQLAEKNEQDCESIRERLTELIGDVNPNSSQQLAKVFYDGERTPRYNKSGSLSVDRQALLDNPGELSTLLIRWRQLGAMGMVKYLKAFRKCDSDRILRINLNQTGARTGRFSSSPNLQNIPRTTSLSPEMAELRSCIVAKPGCRLLFIDCEQIELRLAVHFSGEPHMVDAIRQGQDLHGVTCKLVFGIDEGHARWKFFRYLAKTLNFAMQYGAGAGKFAETVLQQTNGEIRLSYKEAADYVEAYKSTYPNILRLFEDAADSVAKHSGIFNHYGRFMPVSGPSYVGVNYLIQSTAADYLKLKMLELHRFLKPYRTRMALQIHDEIIFDLHASEKHLAPRLKAMMEDHRTFRVPLTCSAEYGRSWKEKKPLPAAVYEALEAVA